MPVSRWTEMRQDDIDAATGLRTLLSSDVAGPALVEENASVTVVDPGKRLEADAYGNLIVTAKE